MSGKPEIHVGSVEEGSPLLHKEASNLSDSHVVDMKSALLKAGSCGSHKHDASSSSAAGGSTIGTCRICFEQETTDSQNPDNPLISPCLCTGSSKYVHRQCLQQWRETNHRADAYYQCEVCKYKYQYRRLWWAGVLGSQATLTTLFVVLMVSCIILLGFIPVTNSFFNKTGSSGTGGDSGSSSSSAAHINPYVLHTVNGVIMMGLMGLLLSMILAVARSCGLPVLAFLPDSWCPGCIWCIDMNGGPGLGWAPFIDCGAAGECGVALLVVLAAVVLIAGIIMAAYLLYGILYLLVQAGLSRAQHMVENVQQDSKENVQEGHKPETVTQVSAT